jgi:hypothetical protein
MQTRTRIERYNQGIVQFLIIIILSVIILSLLGVSLTSLFNDNTIRENFVFLWGGVKHIWLTYIWPYADNAWGALKKITGK